MSAWFKPLCGRASPWLSILTTSAGRAASAGSSIGNPVNGITGSAGMVVDVDVEDCELDDVVPTVVEVAAATVPATEVATSAVVAGDESPEPPQAVTPSAAT